MCLGVVLHNVRRITNPLLLLLLYIQDVAYGTRIRLDSGEEFTVPGAIRTMIPARIIKQYQSYCKSTNFSLLGRTTLYSLSTEVPSRT